MIVIYSIIFSSKNIMIFSILSIFDIADIFTISTFIIIIYLLF